MKFAKIIGSACLALTLSVAAKADTFSNTIASFTTSVTSSDSTQLGRPSRFFIPQDWSGSEPYPGVNPNTVNTTYYYKTFTYAASLFAGGGFLDISDFEPLNTANYYLSAYAGSYDPNNRKANWLGDTGFNGNYQTNTGGDFQVILPTYSDLVLVLLTQGGGTIGLGTPIYIQVDNYSDSAYSLPIAPTPEPSSLLLVGTGVLAAVGGLRRRFTTA